MKDLVRLAKAWSAGQPPSTKWWVHVNVSPLDAELSISINSRKTKLALSFEVNRFFSRVIVYEGAKATYLDDAVRSTFTALLGRYEKKHRVRFRLDRAYVGGGPASLKKAVRAWFANVRDPDPPPAGTFEAIAAAGGASDAKIRSWLHALSGSAGYDVDLARVSKLVKDDAFVAAACAWLERLRSVPDASSKIAFKRAAGAMCVLKRRGDPRSLAAANKFLARAKRTREALRYEQVFESA